MKILKITDKTKHSCASGMKVPAFLAWMCLQLSACGFDFTNPVENLPRGTIRGSLVSGSSGRSLNETNPVANAECTLEGTNTKTESNAQGVFEMTDVPVGAYLLICRYDAQGADLAVLVAVEVEDGEVTDLGALRITPTGSMVGVVTLAEALDSTGISISIPGTSMDATSGSDGAYSLEGVPAGTYSVYFEKSGYAPLQVNDVLVKSGEATQLGDIVLTVSTGPNGSMVLNNGDALSSDRQISMTVSASQEATIMVVSEDSSFLNVPWEAIQRSKTWTFDSDGFKTLYIKFSDGNGQESTPVSASIGIDTTKPIGSVRINNDMEFAPTAMVVLILQATDEVAGVSEMRVGNASDLSESAWQPYQTTLTWELPLGDGEKTVFVQYRDALGHESDVVSDDIEVDSELPAEAQIQILGADYTNRTTIDIMLYSPDPETSGVRLSDRDDFSGSSTDSMEAGVFYTATVGYGGPDGTVTIYAQYVDSSNEILDTVSDSVVLDTTSPTIPTLDCGDQNTNGEQAIVGLATPSTDTYLKGYEVCVIHAESQTTYGCTEWSEIDFAQPLSIAFDREAEVAVLIRAWDLAGNSSSLDPVEGSSSPAICRYSVDWTAPADFYPLLVHHTSTTKVDVEYRTTAGHMDPSPAPAFTFSYGPDGGNMVNLDVPVAYGPAVKSLSGLTPGTKYRVMLTFSDLAGNTSSKETTFTTAKTVVPDLTHISSNTTWTKTASPYLIDGYVSIEATLTIQAGAIIHFNYASESGYINLVSSNGSFIANGSESEPIHFTDMGLRNAAYAGGATIYFQNAVFHGRGQVNATTAVATVEESLFLDHMSLFFGELYSGDCSSANLMARNNYFVYGVTQTDAVQIQCNNDPESLTFENNAFMFANAQVFDEVYPVYAVHVAFLLGSVTFDMSNNYWGTTNSETIGTTMILDGNDFSGEEYPTIDYTPFSTAPSANIPDPTPYL